MRDLLSKPLFVGLFLLVFSFVVRILLISKGAFSIDCLSITVQAENFLDTRSFPRHFGFGYPLTILLASIFVFFGRLLELPDGVLAVNFMSVVFGSLCVPLFYLPAVRMTDKTTAFLSAVLLSLCPIFMAVSVYGIGHTPALFFLLLGLWLLIKYFEQNRRSWLILSAVCFGAAGAARIQDLIVFLPALIFFSLFVRHILPGLPAQEGGKKLRSLAILILGSMLVAVLFHVPYLLAESRVVYLEQLGHYRDISVAAGTDIRHMTRAFIYNIMYLTQTLSILGLILAAVGMFLIARERRALFVFLLIWIIVPLAMLSRLHTLLPRHQVIMLTPFLLAEGYALARMLRYGVLFRATSRIILVLILFLTFVHYLPYLDYRHRHSFITDYSRWLGQVTEPGARIIATDMGAFIKRYAGRQPQGRMLQDRAVLTNSQLQGYKNELEVLLDRGVPVYITKTGLYTYDAGKKFSNFMHENFEIEYVGSHLYEDWHRDYLKARVIHNPLYRIGKR